jgi:coproporphyrinogen III oxidase-like Fe-S oxidoreductase
MNKVEVWPGINDGQFLLSKNIAKRQILEHIKFYVNHTLSYNKDRLTKEDHLALHWVSVQYAVFDYFQNTKNPVKHFDSSEVMLHLEPNYNDRSSLILQHYYNGNFEKVVPEEFR